MAMSRIDSETQGVVLRIADRLRKIAEATATPLAFTHMAHQVAANALLLEPSVI